MKAIHFNIFMLALFFLAINVNCQNATIGIKCGAVITKPYTNFDTDYYVALPQSLTSFGGSAQFLFKIGNRFGIGLEPGYIRKGGTADERERLPEKIVLNYFNTPVTLNVFILDKFTLGAGLEFAFLLKANELDKGEKKDVTDEMLNKFELSGMAEISYALVDYLDIGFKYSRAFTESMSTVILDNTGQIAGSGEVLNQYFQLFICYKLVK